MRTRRTKNQIEKDRYNSDVDSYQWYVVNLDTKRAETGFEFKEDAIDLLNDYENPKKYKVVSKRTLKIMGIENPNASFKYVGGGYTDLSKRKPEVINESESEKEDAEILEAIQTLQSLLNDSSKKDNDEIVNNNSISKNGVEIPEIDIEKIKMIDLDITDNKILSLEDTIRVLKQLYDKGSINAYEEVKILYLDNSNKVIGVYTHSKGGIAGTIVDIEMICGLALKCLAKGVIMSHNHPSGSLIFSDADIKVTTELKNALNLFKIALLDSVIITDFGYQSMTRQGILANGGSLSKFHNGGYFDGTIPEVSSYMTTYATGGGISENEVDRFKKAMNDKTIATYKVSLKHYKLNNELIYYFRIKIEDNKNGCFLTPYEYFTMKNGMGYDINNVINRDNELVPNNFDTIPLNKTKTKQLVDKLIQGDTNGVEKFLNLNFFTQNDNFDSKVDDFRYELKRYFEKTLYNNIQKIDFTINSKFDDKQNYANGGSLIGNQSRIDLNKNGKIDAEDFSLLRSTMNGAWRKEHKYVNSTSRKDGKVIEYEVRYAKKNKPSRIGYKGKTDYVTGGVIDSFSEYSDDALYDMIINLSRYQNTESDILRVKAILEKRKNIWQNIFEQYGFKKGQSKYGLDMYYKRGYNASVNKELRKVDFMFEDDIIYSGYKVEGLLKSLESEFSKKIII
jgi:DNA repair protein RadC